MPRVPIADLDDPRIALYRNLKATNRTRSSGQFVVEGEKLLDRLLASPLAVASVLVGDRHEARVGAKVPAEVPLYVVPHGLLDVLVGFNFHQGVLAAGVRPAPFALNAVAAQLGARATLIVCPRLDNPENLGALVRLADVFGVQAILLGPRCPDPFSRRVLRVSMGTVLRLPVIPLESPERDVARLGSSWRFTTVATTTDPDAEPLDTFQRPDRLALVFGSESAGLGPEWTARCDRQLTIPMGPGAESLNVAVAAGIILWHVSRECLRSEERGGLVH
jgi:tRNA G18 (ribose-2'-O)-methylase SpoU